MKALISIIFGTWMLALCAGVQAQTRSVTSVEPAFSRAELDQMLAPIALYPDTVLSHILIAATYPLEVVEAERWTRRNRGLEAEEAVNAASLEGWDPSVAALVAFPDILGRMSDDLDWTQDLGDAFLADEGRVMDAIQNLRERAYASGQLKKMKHVKVARENRIIVIEPAVERVVYVPYYDTRVVYGPWWWDSYPPVYWRAPATYVHVGGFYWSPRIYLGTTFFFSSVHWSQRRVVVIDYHHHDHHPRFYSGRKIAHYHGARHWEHNPVHRHNIVYRSEPVRQRYASHDSRRFNRDWRDDRHNDHRSDNRRFTDDGHRNDGHRSPVPARLDAKRDQRNDANVRHTDPRERPDFRNGERREHAGQANPGLPRQPDRAQEIRERLAANRAGEPSRLKEPGRPVGEPGRPVGEPGRPDAPSRATEPNRSSSSQGEWRNRDKAGVVPRQDESRSRDRPDVNARQEHLQRVQPQNTDRDWRAERREQAQKQQDEKRAWQQQRAEQRETRQDRTPVQREIRQERPQQEQRRFEPSRGQHDNSQQRSSPAPRSGDREHRFER